MRSTGTREKVPHLLLSDEKVILAYKDRGGKGRDSSTFTNFRIIIMDKTGLTGKKTKYKTSPTKLFVLTLVRQLDLSMQMLRYLIAYQ
jgi:hypothetical protein